MGGDEELAVDGDRLEAAWLIFNLALGSGPASCWRLHGKTLLEVICTSVTVSAVKGESYFQETP